MHGKAFHVKLLAGHHDSNLKAHELYHHLITRHDHTMVASEQSPGGKRVWDNLHKMKGVGIHGWDPKKDQPVNVHYGRDDTHADDSEKSAHPDVHRMLLVAHKKGKS